MKVRSVYFKTDRIDEAAAWWGRFLEAEPIADFGFYRGFSAGNVNLGLLSWEGPLAEARTGRWIPVFEFPDDQIDAVIARAKALGADAVLEGKDHPDHPDTAAVLIDPFGNEFEVTNLHS
jgi:predicted enzyme related to lactoylglutathione lyase